MLLALATSLNSTPLPPISDRHGVRLPPPQHCLTNVNFSIVPNPPPSDFFDEEEQRAPVQSQAQTAVNVDSESDSDAEEADVSMAAVEPTQTSQDDQRGTKRSLDEDEDYD